MRDHVGAEEAARAMSGAQRRAYLVARGWRRLGRATWLRPTFDAPGGDRGFYSLAAAVRVTLIEERG